ncbi:transmembrane protein 161B [Fagus crenata]
MLLQFLLTYKNPILHTTLALSLTFLFSFFKIPSFFLYGLHTYIQPDNLNQNGVRAAIKRPESSGTPEGYQYLSSNSKPNNATEPRKRIKSKDKDKFEFDENNAQIFRLKLDTNHVQSRLYFDEYHTAFTVSFVSLSCLLLQFYLGVSDSSRVLENGVFVPVLLGLMGVSKLFVLLAKVSFEKSASRRSEKQLSVLVGVLGFFVGLMICFAIVHSVLDFNFGLVGGVERFFVAVLMGCIAGFLFMPGLKNARALWIGTDQLRSNLPMIYCGWFARMILYANHMLIMFTALLWINPFTEILVNKSNDDGKGARLVSEIGDAERLVGNVGMSRSDLNKLRLWCLLLSGLLQIVALRPNLQMYLNEALLSWYQRLHASKVPDLDFSRAKVFLHNHYICLVVLQFFAAPILVLLFVGLSQIDGNSFRNIQSVCSLLPCSVFVEEVALFLAWWVVFVWAIFTSGSLVLYRRGILYVS